MNILVIILLAAGGITIIPLGIAFFTRKNYYVKTSAVVNTTQQKVFDYIKMLKNQDSFNKWVMMDPEMKREYKGVDGTVGFIYGWNGNKKAGEGELEIKAIEEGKSIDTEVRFVRPFPGLAHATMSTEALNNEQTKITWSNTSTLKYPMNIMIPMIEKMLKKDMDESLAMLKAILEKK
jgi:hypothetical protein